MAIRRGVRRSEGFAVRRWLQVGAASAGVGAGLLGFSLLGPQVGTAAADTAGESSTSSAPSEGGSSESTAGSGAETPAGTKKEDDAAPAETKKDDAATDDGAATDDDADTAAEDAASDDDLADAADETTDDEADDAAADPDEAAAEPTADETEPAAEPVVDTGARAKLVAPQADPPAPTTATRAAAPKPSPTNWSAFTGQAIDNWTTSSQGWINALPVDGQAKYLLGGALWTTRRTLFNQAPDVAPVQISGKLDGPIVGTVGAVDPDGDRLIYVVTRGPKNGSVHLNADGTYTYTPGTGFDGVDMFRVVAIDVGPHVNLLDPFRRIGTEAGNLVNQRAVTFTFSYGDGAEYWTPERRAALGRVADRLIEYFTVTKAVDLSYDVLGEDDPESTTLAWAFSDAVSADEGFWRTVVQNKIISGVDSNGAKSDGQVAFNFGEKWGLGETVADDEFDFTSTAIHELLHSFGFMTSVDSAGNNADRYWLIYDSYIVTADGRRPIGSDHVWDSQYDPYLTGKDGGFYFGGANAVAAYGGLVPLFTPDPWRSGSSMHHLDDFTFTGANQKVMNAMAGVGPHVRELSPIEIGVLKDLGYWVSAPVVQL